METEMISELSFLIELLLNHDLPKATKDLLAARIKEVEANLVSKPQVQQQISHTAQQAALQAQFAAQGNKQAASTLALMAKHGDIPNMVSAPDMPVIEPVAVIAQTPQTAAALNHRNETIAAAIAGKNLDKSSGRPRKW